MDTNYFLQNTNKSIGDSMRLVRDFQANPEKYKAATNTPGTTPAPAPAPANPLDQYMLYMMMMMLMKMMQQMGGGSGGFPFPFPPGFPMPPGGSTPPPAHDIPGPAPTPNPAPTPAPTGNPAYDYLENLFKDLEDYPEGADFTQQLEHALDNGDFTEAQLGEALKYQLVNASDTERPFVGKMLAGLFDSGTLNPVSFMLDNYVSKLPPDRWSTLRGALVSAGMLTSDGNTNTRLASFLLQAVNQTEDTPSRAFARDLMRELNTRYQALPDTDPGKQSFMHLVNLANIKIKDGLLDFPGDNDPVDDVDPVDPPVVDPPAPPPANDVAQWNPQGGIPDFVKTLYQNILDRNPESQDVVNWWTSQTSAKGLVETVRGFFNSDEFKAKNMSPEDTVEKLYESILNRHSDAGGKAHWVGLLKGGMPINEMIGHFFNSDEYKQRVANGSAPNPAATPPAPPPDPGFGIAHWTKNGGNDAIARSLYLNVLDREPESTQVVSAWAFNIATKGLAFTIKGFFNSAEYKGKNKSVEDTVEKLYESILGRSSDAGGKAHWVNLIKSGQMSLDQVIDGFLNSTEFKNKA